MNVVVAILYAPEGRKPLSIARIYDRNLLATAAETALREAEDVAREVVDGDPVLGALQIEEVNKLRRVLGRLMPAAGKQETPSVM